MGDPARPSLVFVDPALPLPSHEEETAPVARTTDVFATHTAVFGALTEPSALSRWIAPRGRTSDEMLVDPRVGGGIRFAVAGADGAGATTIYGCLRAIDPRGHLDATVLLEEGVFLREYRITVDLERVGVMTRVHVRANAEARNMDSARSQGVLRAAVEATLERLHAYVEGITAQPAIRSTEALVRCLAFAAEVPVRAAPLVS
jgi:uncharacterized protein YndB with AHSA1/START domain